MEKTQNAKEQPMHAHGIDTGVLDQVRTQMGRNRLAALAGAVLEHERSSRRRSVAARPHDSELYRRLREIYGTKDGLGTIGGAR
jgi:hypothetical protein